MLIEPRWSVAEHDGRYSVGDALGLYGFEIIPFQRRGKLSSPHLTKDERRRQAEHVVMVLNNSPGKLGDLI